MSRTNSPTDFANDTIAPNSPIASTANVTESDIQSDSTYFEPDRNARDSSTASTSSPTLFNDDGTPTELPNDIAFTKSSTTSTTSKNSNDEDKMDEQEDQPQEEARTMVYPKSTASTDSTSTASTTQVSSEETKDTEMKEGVEGVEGAEMDKSPVTTEEQSEKKNNFPEVVDDKSPTAVSTASTKSPTPNDSSSTASEQSEIAALREQLAAVQRERDDLKKQLDLVPVAPVPLHPVSTQQGRLTMQAQEAINGYESELAEAQEKLDTFRGIYTSEAIAEQQKLFGKCGDLAIRIGNLRKVADLETEMRNLALNITSNKDTGRFKDLLEQIETILAHPDQQPGSSTSTSSTASTKSSRKSNSSSRRKSTSSTSYKTDENKTPVASGTRSRKSSTSTSSTASTSSNNTPAMHIEDDDDVPALEEESGQSDDDEEVVYQKKKSKSSTSSTTSSASKGKKKNKSKDEEQRQLDIDLLNAVTKKKSIDPIRVINKINQFRWNNRMKGQVLYSTQKLDKDHNNMATFAYVEILPDSNSNGHFIDTLQLYNGLVIRNNALAVEMRIQRILFAEETVPSGVTSNGYQQFRFKSHKDGTWVALGKVWTDRVKSGQELLDVSLLPPPSDEELALEREFEQTVSNAKNMKEIAESGLFDLYPDSYNDYLVSVEEKEPVTIYGGKECPITDNVRSNAGLLLRGNDKSPKTPRSKSSIASTSSKSKSNSSSGSKRKASSVSSDIMFDEEDGELEVQPHTPSTMSTSSKSPSGNAGGTGKPRGVNGQAASKAQRTNVVGLTPPPNNMVMQGHQNAYPMQQQGYPTQQQMYLTPEQMAFFNHQALQQQAFQRQAMHEQAIIHFNTQQQQEALGGSVSNNNNQRTNTVQGQTTGVVDDVDVGNFSDFTCDM